MSDQELLPGTMIAEKYRIETPIGSGGFGTVYRATHLAMNRSVAVKIFKPTAEQARDQNMLAMRTERFNREAQFASQLQHANTVRIYDFGPDKDMLYLVMEYVEGETIAEVLERRRRLPLIEALNVILRVLDSLEEAHHKGFLHRDIKPANVLISRDFKGKDVVKVLDFGIAKQVLDGPSAASEQDLTGNGFVGTPEYCSPEQLFGRPLSKATDLFAVGLLLWEMICGAPLIKSNSLSDVLRQFNSAEPWVMPSQPPIPESLSKVLKRAVQRDMSARFQSCAEMRGAVEVVLRELKKDPALKPPAVPPIAKAQPLPESLLTEDANEGFDGLDDTGLDLDAMVEASKKPSRPSMRPTPGPVRLPQPAADLDLDLDVDWKGPKRAPESRPDRAPPLAYAPEGPRRGRLAQERDPSPLDALGPYKMHALLGVGVVAVIGFLFFGPIDWQKERRNPALEAERLLGEINKLTPPTEVAPGIGPSRFSESGIIVAAQSIGWRVVDRSESVNMGTMEYRLFSLHHAKANVGVDLFLYRARTAQAVDEIVDGTRAPDQSVRFDSIVAKLSPRARETHPEVKRLATFLTRYRDGVLELNEP